MKKASEVDAAGQPIGMPSFDEQALSQLTDKIENGLRKVMAPITVVKPYSQKSKAGNSLSGKSLETSDRQRLSTASKKRDSRGKIKRSGNTVPKISRQTKDGDGKGDAHERDILLEEILALGGTEEDLDFVMGEDSDQDDTINKSQRDQTPDAKLARELSKFITKLGIQGEGRIELDPMDSGVSNITRGVKMDDTPPIPISAIVVKARDINSSSLRASAKLGGKPEEEAKGRTRLVFEARPDWHAVFLPSLPLLSQGDPIAPGEALAELKKYAYSLLEADGDAYASKNLSSTSSHRFLSTIMSSGTLSDKISALTLVIQESPVHTIKSFEALLALAKKRSRGQAVTALGAIKDLLGVGTVLPADRRLKFFQNQPGLLASLQGEYITQWKMGDRLPGHITKSHMISWAYEDWLKNVYFEVLKVLEGWCNDEVEFARGRAITYVYELMREKPEEESNLLRLLVNKLGDPDKKIASRTSYLILQLQTTHPLMKSIIIHAIENELLLRPGQGPHAKYYAINTLNQTVLSEKEEDIARKLLSLYFHLFVSLLRRPDPLKPAPGPIINKKGQIQGGGGAKGKKAEERAKKEELAKQASVETTEKLISAVLTGVNRAFPFAKSDDSTLERHMDMLFKITHSSNFNTSIQALILIQQLAASKQIGEERFYRTLYDSLLDPRLITSSKHAMYLNLLFRALKSDLSIKRVKAFAKRLLQILTLHQPPFICGVLYLLKELEESFAGLTSLFREPEEWDELDEEVFLDVPETTKGEVTLTESQKHGSALPNRVSSERSHRQYDGRKRDPEHSKAENSCLWELLPFLSHFHPSVSMFASCLLHGMDMPVKPDLASHTLIHFLDRFVYKNAKAASGNLRGNSIMQPMAGGESSGSFVTNRPLKLGSEPVNSESFWRKNVEDIAVDEVFFHKYFNQMGKEKKSARKKANPAKKTQLKHDEDSDKEDEDEIWQALIQSRAEIEDQGDDGSDLEIPDFDDSDDDSRSEGSADPGSDDKDDEYEGSLAELDPQATYSQPEADVFSGEEDSPLGEDKLFRKEMETGHALTGVVQGKEPGKKRRKLLRNLPLFASTDDYADMLASEDESL